MLQIRPFMYLCKVITRWKKMDLFMKAKELTNRFLEWIRNFWIVLQIFSFGIFVIYKPAILSATITRKIFLTFLLPYIVFFRAKPLFRVHSSAFVWHQNHACYVVKYERKWNLFSMVRELTMEKINLIKVTLMKLWNTI